MLKGTIEHVSQIVIGLKHCSKLKNLEGGKQLHCDAIAMKVESDKYVAAALITMYSRCHTMPHARDVFDRTRSRDIVVWNCLIRGYIDTGDFQTGVDMFSVMDCKPTRVTYLIVLKAYANLASLTKGIAIHKQIKEYGYECHVLVATALIEMYTKCGSMCHARNVFRNMVHHDVVVWNFLIQGYVENGMHSEAISLFNSKDFQSDCKPNSFTYMAVLKACGFGAQGSESDQERQTYVDAGSAIRVRIKQDRLERDMSVAAGLVDMYSRCGLMSRARDVFDTINCRSVYTWTSLILGYLASGDTSLALNLFFNMDCAPNSFLCVTLLKSWGTSSSSLGVNDKCAWLLDQGIMIHKRVNECGLGGDMLVTTALIDMYSKCGDMNLAKQTFDSMGERDVVTWTCLISGYVTNGQPWMAIHVFDSMECEPDCLTYVAVIKACGGDKNVSKGMEIHQRLREIHNNNMLVSTSLLDMYSKCGCMEHARAVFERIKVKDAAAWNSLLLGYVDNGQSSQAMELYAVMDCKATHITCLAVIKACANLVALPAGRQIHSKVEQDGVSEHHRVGAALLDMYARCGCITRAEEMFNKMQNSDVVWWNTLLCGYSCVGDYSEVFRVAKQMKEGGIGMDDITYTCVLTACKHAGMVEQGRRCFMSMLASGVCLSVENYNCMVDLLSRRSNGLHQALALVNAMPFHANHVTWHTLLTAACTWNDLEVGRIAFHQLAADATDTATAYVALSDTYRRLNITSSSFVK